MTVLFERSVSAAAVVRDGEILATAQEAFEVKLDRRRRSKGVINNRKKESAW